jgi:hypothetical protein
MSTSTTPTLAEETEPYRSEPSITVNGSASATVSKRDLALWVGIGLPILALALYVRTLAPSVMPGDYAEFQFSAAILGVPHPTGYPLYILLGKLFTLLPVGDVAYRVNLSSAVYMAAAVGVLYALALRVLNLMGLKSVWWAAGIGAGLFAVAPTVWSMSLVARSYALNALLVGCVVFSLVTWRTTGPNRWFYASCLFIGLSMVHHGTTYLLLPAYGVYLLIVEFERRRSGEQPRQALRRRALGVLSLLVGFSPLLFLVYRFVGGSPYYWGNPTTWRDFFNLLTGGPFHAQIMGFGWSSQLDRIAFGLGELAGQYTVVGIAFGVLGWIVLWRVRKVEALLFTVMLAGNFFFAMNYSLVGYLYFIPTYLLWALFMAVGLAWLGNRAWWYLRGRLQPVLLRGISLLGAIAFAPILISFITLRYPSIDQSGQTASRDQALRLLSTAPQGSSIYLDWEALSVLRFYRYVYGMRTDLTLHSGDPADWAKEVYCDVAAGTTSYVGEFAGAQPAIIARDFALEVAPMGWRVTGVLNPDLYEIPPCGTCATCR